MKTLVLTCLFSLFLSGCVGEEKKYPHLSVNSETSITEPSEGVFVFRIPLVLNREGSKSNFKISVSLRHISTNDDDVSLLSDSGFMLMEDSTVDEIRLLIKSDDFIEQTEKFVIDVTSNDINIENASTVIEIFDSTSETVVSFENDVYVLTEGIANQSIRINIDNPPQKEDVILSLDFSGTATHASAEEGGDYLIDSDTTIIIPAGVGSHDIPVSVFDDNKPEGGENVIIKITSSEYIIDGDTTTIFIPGDLVINDSGETQFFNGVGFQEEASLDYPKQDAQYGLDVDSSDSDGPSGFRFSKIDFAGNATPASDPSSFRCVKDENTGLLWEVKNSNVTTPNNTSSGTYVDFIQETVALSQLDEEDEDYQPYPYHLEHASWQSSAYTYYWWDDNVETNGGHQGVQGNAIFSGYPMLSNCAFPNITQINYNDSILYCSSDHYTQYANSLAVCGVKEWRLPTIEELRSVLNYQSGSDGLDSSYFPLMNGNTYMSSTPYAQEKGSYWCMDTGNKQIELCNKQYPASIMLVRGDK